MPEHRTWTAKEITSLGKLIKQRYSYAAIAQMLGRSERSVAVKAHKMGMGLGSGQSSNAWTDAELDALEGLWKHVAKAAKKLQRRPRAILRRMLDQGINP